MKVIFYINQHTLAKRLCEPDSGENIQVSNKKREDLNVQIIVEEREISKYLGYGIFTVNIGRVPNK